MNALTLLEQQHSEHQFKDKKRHLWLFGLAYPCIALGALAGYQFGPKNYVRCLPRQARFLCTWSCQLWINS